ncbi:MAG TPA: hypothetical protein ACFYDZ_03775 [Candidatus Brocadiaceae bacterium]
MNLKRFLFKHFEKFILGLAGGYLIYAIACTFIIKNSEIHKIDTKVLSITDNIERKLQKSTPPAIETELKNASQLESRFTFPLPAHLLEHPQLFGKLLREEPVSPLITKDILKKQEVPILPHLEAPAQADTEFIFKGGTEDLALIQVKKLYKEIWWTSSFTVSKGDTIGSKKMLGNETIDFDTHCKLLEITPLAQKPLVIKKNTVILNEKGEFLNTSLIEETHMVTSSRIVFENKKEVSYTLWLGESATLGEEFATVQLKVNLPSGN